MTKKTRRFNNIKVNNKKFHISEEPVYLMSVNIDQIVVSDKCNNNNNGSKYFIGYQKGEIVKPVCIILPQMSGYIKNTLNTEVWTCLFLIKYDDDEVRKKFKEICDLIKNKLGIIFIISRYYIISRY